MNLSGKERDEKEWENLFLDAGFSGYKIISHLGLGSLIEIYLSAYSICLVNPCSTFAIN